MKPMDPARVRAVMHAAATYGADAELVRHVLAELERVRCGEIVEFKVVATRRGVDVLSMTKEQFSGRDGL